MKLHLLRLHATGGLSTYGPFSSDADGREALAAMHRKLNRYLSNEKSFVLESPEGSLYPFTERSHEL